MNNDKIEGRDFVAVGHLYWDVQVGNNCKDIITEIAKHNRVLYVNPPLDRITILKQKSNPYVQKSLKVIKGKENDIVKVEENIWGFYPKSVLESINWIKIGWLFNKLNKRNNIKFSAQIKSAVDRLGFRDIIFFNDSAMFRSFYIKELLNPALSIYYIRDYLIAVDYWKTHGERIEPELISKSDLIVTNSPYYTNYGKKYNKNSYYVGQGCDESIFTEPFPENVPIDIKNTSKPIIGYVGTLYKLRLDIELLAYIAKTKPEWSIVLIGPEDDAFKESELHKLENVHFLGPKDITLLTSYVNSFDVCINPQVVNPITIGNYPLKVDVYLALGKPVVATKTEAMKVFENHTYLAESKEDYVELIEKALSEDSKEKIEERRRLASTHTWSNCVKEIYKAINKVKDHQTDKVIEPALHSSGFLNRIKSSSKMKKIVLRMLMPKNQARPRLWVKLFLNPLKHKKGKRSLIRRRTRCDLMPFNKFVLGDDSTIEDFSTINNGVGDVIIGDRTRIGMSNVLIGPITIGNDVMFAQNIVLSGLNHGYKDIDIPPSSQKTTTNEIKIEDEVWIGANAVVTAGVTVGKHSVVAAGAVVTKSIPTFSVAVGNPAKVILKYNFENKLWEKI